MEMDRVARWEMVAGFAATALVCADSPVAPERSPLLELPPDLAAVTFVAEGSPTAPYTESRPSTGKPDILLRQELTRPSSWSSFIHSNLLEQYAPRGTSEPAV